MAIWELGVGLFLYSKQNLLLPVLLSLSLSLSEITVPVLDKAISMCLWLISRKKEEIFLYLGCDGS